MVRSAADGCTSCTGDACCAQSICHSHPSCISPAHAHPPVPTTQRHTRVHQVRERSMLAFTRWYCCGQFASLTFAGMLPCVASNPSFLSLPCCCVLRSASFAHFSPRAVLVALLCTRVRNRRARISLPHGGGAEMLAAAPLPAPIVSSRVRTTEATSPSAPPCNSAPESLTTLLYHAGFRLYVLVKQRARRVLSRKERERRDCMIEKMVGERKADATGNTEPAAKLCVGGCERRVGVGRARDH